MNTIEVIISGVSVDISEVSEVEISYALTDLRDYGSRTSSFSKSIRVLNTAKSFQVFNNLFDVRASDGFDVNTQITASIRVNSITVINGFLKVEEITSDYYDVVVFTPNINLIKILGDELIYGNDISPEIDAMLISQDEKRRLAGDVVFDTAELTNHTPTRAYIRNQWINEPASGESIIYPVVGHNNLLNFIGTPYYVYPALNVLKLVNKIASTNGYELELSTEIENYLKDEYIPYNGVNSDIANPSEVLGGLSFFHRNRFGASQFYLKPGFGGNDNDNITVNLSDNADYEVLKIPRLTVSAIPHTLTDDANDVWQIVAPSANDSDNHATDAQYFKPVHRGSIAFDFSFVNGSRNNAFNTSGTAHTVGVIIDDGAGNITTNSTDIPFDELNEAGNAWISTEQLVTIQVEGLTPNHTVYFTMTYGSTSGNLIDYAISNSTNNTISIRYTDWPFDVVDRNENDILPRNYTQANFLTDVFRKFNSYIDVDKINPLKLIIKSYVGFYSNRETKDFTNYLDYDSVVSMPLANDTQKTTNFNFLADSDDLYLDDYEEVNGITLGSLVVTNPSSLADSSSDIEFNFAVTSIQNDGLGFSGISIPIIGDGETLNRTEFEPRILFRSTVTIPDSLTIQWGGDDTTNMTSFLSLNTVADRTNAEDRLALTTNNSIDYNVLDNTTRSNVTIFNKYYKNDIERRFLSNARTVEADLILPPNEIANISLSDRLYFKTMGYFRIEEITSYSASTGDTEIILVKEIDESDIVFNNTTNVLETQLSPDAEETLVNSNVTPSTSATTGTISGLTEEEANALYHPLGGASDIDFATADLAISGTATRNGNTLYGADNANKSDVDWVANNLEIYGNITTRDGEIINLTGEVVKIDDAIVEVNSGNSEVDSGLRISIDESGGVSSLLRHASDDKWKIDGVDIALLDGTLQTNLNADMLDGLEGSQFLRSDTDDTATGLLSIQRTGEQLRLGYNVNDSQPFLAFYDQTTRRGFLQIRNTGTFEIASDLLNASLNLDDGTSTGLKHQVGNTAYTIWDAGNDGDGSGLDADLLDGLQGSQFLRSDADDSFSGILTKSTAGEAIVIGGGTALDSADAWIRIGNASLAWQLKYVGSTSGTGGNEFRIESTNTGRYIQLDHAGNFEYYDGTNLNTFWHAANSNISTVDWTMNNAIIYGNADSDNYNGTGFTNAGWAILGDDSGDSHAIFDRATVRGRMDVYELIHNKIRTVNGSWLISAGSAQVDRTTTEGGDIRVYLVLDDIGGNPFVIDDQVIIQNFNGRNVHRTILTIISTGTDYIDCETDEGDENLIAGGDTVAVWNSDVDGRGGIIYLTASDSNAPYIDVLNNQTIHLRSGSLAGISGQTGYGIWGSANGTNEAFVISSGTDTVDAYARIAGWNFDNLRLRNTITSGDIQLGQPTYQAAQYGLFVGDGTDTNVIKMFTVSDGRGFIQGRVNGNTIFDLRTSGNSQIAGWTFNTATLSKAFTTYTLSIGTEVNGRSSVRGFHVANTTGSISRVSMGTTETGNAWGLWGTLNATNIFRLGDENHIANWTFDTESLYSGAKFSSGAGVEINSSNRYLSAHLDSDNYVQMGYENINDWGLRGVVNGITVFNLTTVPFIGGWLTDGTRFYSEDGRLILHPTEGVTMTHPDFGTMRIHQGSLSNVSDFIENSIFDGTQTISNQSFDQNDTLTETFTHTGILTNSNLSLTFPDTNDIVINTLTGTVDLGGNAPVSQVIASATLTLNNIVLTVIIRDSSSNVLSQTTADLGSITRSDTSGAATPGELTRFSYTFNGIDFTDIPSIFTNIGNSTSVTVEFRLSVGSSSIAYSARGRDLNNTLVNYSGTATAFGNVVASTNTVRYVLAGNRSVSELTPQGMMHITDQNNYVRIDLGGSDRFVDAMRGGVRTLEG